MKPPRTEHSQCPNCGSLEWVCSWPIEGTRYIKACKGCGLIEDLDPHLGQRNRTNNSDIFKQKHVAGNIHQDPDLV